MIYIFTLATSLVFAETITIQEGATFELPTGLVSQANQTPPVSAAWVNKENTVAVFLISIKKSQNEMKAAGLEFKDWPSVGLSTVKGFGNSLAKSLEKSLSAPCSFSGEAENRDFNTVSFWITVETRCKTPDNYNLKSRVIQVFLKDSIAMIRIDASPSTEKFGEKVAATIWNSIQVDQNVRLNSIQTNDNSESDKASLSGGKGFFLVDYRTIKPAALVGIYLGSIIGSILYGMLFTFILIKLKANPTVALISSQLIIIALKIYGAEENGAWELDPILYLTTSTIAVLALWKWAKKKSKA